MIIDRYIQRNIHLGTFAALLVLVSLSLFFLFVRELGEVGEGDFGLLQLLQYLALSVPGNLVEFMPLAVLLGSILSLGALAGNSEIIAMQASGVSFKRMILALLQAAMTLAVLSFLVADWIVPDSEINARKIKNLTDQSSLALNPEKGLWLKDESRVVHIETLLPNGYALGIEIYQLDDEGRLMSTIRAESALPLGKGWELHQVRQSFVSAQASYSKEFERLVYDGKLSNELLQVLMLEPRQMSSWDLSAYLNFLEENNLDAKVERLIFWQKLMAPVTIVVMCLLAFPFVLGSQRQANTGQRLLVGILLGLAFVVVDRLMVQLGTQLDINSSIVAMLPSLIFLSLAIILLLKKRSQAFILSSWFRWN